MVDREIILEQTRSTLNQQVEEIRDQRNQALRILRLYGAITAFIIAGSTTLIATSSVPVIELLPFRDGRLVGPLLVVASTLLMASGIGTFYRGVFSSLKVLSPEPIIKHGWLYPVYFAIYAVLKKEDPRGEAYNAVISPGFDEIDSSDLSVDYLINKNTDGIKENKETIGSNRGFLHRVYNQMAMGMTGIIMGLFALLLGIS